MSRLMQLYTRADESAPLRARQRHRYRAAATATATALNSGPHADPISAPLPSRSASHVSPSELSRCHMLCLRAAAAAGPRRGARTRNGTRGERAPALQCARLNTYCSMLRLRRLQSKNEREKTVMACSGARRPVLVSGRVGRGRCAAAPLAGAHQGADADLRRGLAGHENDARRRDERPGRRRDAVKDAHDRAVRQHAVSQQAEQRDDSEQSGLRAEAAHAFAAGPRVGCSSAAAPRRACRSLPRT